MRSCFRLIAIVLLSVLLMATGGANAASNQISLYDAASKNLPTKQGFIFLSNPLSGIKATQTFADSATILDTTLVKSESAGYFGKAGLIPELNRSAGFSVNFTVQILAENHDGSDKNGDGTGDRAGFSIIALSSDLKGVEIGFWANRIWVQNDGKALFTQGEGANFDTTKSLTTYSLNIKDDNYSLLANDTKILSGKLRVYSAFGLPYNQRNFLFLGDDTASAMAKIKLTKVSISQPEPAKSTPNPEINLFDIILKVLKQFFGS